MKNGVAGENKERKSEENFRERDEETERKSFSDVVGEFGARVDEFGEAAREPEFGGAFAFVIEKPCNDAKRDEKSEENDMTEVGKRARFSEAGDKEERRAEEEKVHKCNAGDERRGERLGLFTDVFAE